MLRRDIRNNSECTHTAAARHLGITQFVSRDAGGVSCGIAVQVQTFERITVQHTGLVLMEVLEGIVERETIQRVAGIHAQVKRFVAD